MKGILKGRWFVPVIWIILTAVLVMTAPPLNDLVRDKGQITVPDGYSSKEASYLLEQIAEQKGKGNESQVAAVFHNPEGITGEDEKQILVALNKIENKKEDYYVNSVVTHLEQEDLKEQLLSKDLTTMIAIISVEMNQEVENKEISQKLYSALEEVKTEHYLTSGWLIDEDVMQSSQEGLKKTEYVTVIFILVILFVVFKSLVAPFIPLLAIGISYVSSQAIVAFLVDGVNFPLSNFTQIFMVAVMFGIGTDYCILLISRFKEELSKRDRFEAIIETYRTAGKTVFVSGLAVMIGFSSIGFSTFILYRSAAAVAVGIAVLIVALFTIVPFFMAVLGPKLFFPSKGSLEHGESKLWGLAGRFSLARPILALAIVAIIITPALLSYDGEISFNSLEEIGDGYPSVKAFNLISDRFGPGDSLPGKVIIKHEKQMDSKEYFTIFEKLSRDLERLEGISAVRSVTRPIGEPIEELKITTQLDELNDGLGQGNDGIQQIKSGFEQASSEISASIPELNQAGDGIEKLINGTSELRQGVVQLQNGLSDIHKGLQQGTIGASELQKGIVDLQKGAEQLANSGNQLLQSYQSIAQNVSTIQGHYSNIESQLMGISQGLELVGQSLANVAEKQPELNQDEDFQAAKQRVEGLTKGSQELAQGLAQLNGQFKQLSAGIQEATAGLEQVVGGQKNVAAGIKKLQEGAAGLHAGLAKLTEGQGTVVSQVPKVSNGMSEVNEGQKKLLEGFQSIGSQMTQLTDGLDQGVDGLAQVSDGLASAQDYLVKVAKTEDPMLAGWYLPAEALEEEEFQQVLDMYLSPDKTIATLDIIFAQNPYSMESIMQVEDIKKQIQLSLEGTELENATFELSGVTSVYSDLNQVSDADYSKTVMLMLIGIGLILVVLLRSIVMPVYLIASLMLTYYSAMGITEFIFIDILGYTGISWAVPFFSFVILVALGVDYCIFLMSRFNEYAHLDIETAILLAMKNMGTVIISAVVILGGTFAAMYPSGVLSLLQIATIIITGLVLYSFIFLPLFVPVMVKLFGKANWWPFMKREITIENYGEKM